jgi:S-adenosylmethionine-dependent methyltransferase
MINKIKVFAKKKIYSAPKAFTKNHVIFSKSEIELLKNSIENNYLNRGNTKNKLSSNEYLNALEGQLFNRLDYNRNRIIPWLSSIKKLDALNILEIGCGTGISTLALCEQGAKVTGIDVDEGALKVAKDRLKIAKFNADFYHENACNIKNKFSNKKFDLIIYYAVLEHMTVKERLESLNQAWQMLPKNGFLAVIETPNRLWYYDSHTAALPFYDWLPDELAFYYSKFSKRKVFNTSYKKLSDDNMNSFIRWGRGASYHEFELAIAPLEELNIVSSLMQFEKTVLLKCGFKGMKYIKFLKSNHKNLPNGFCYPYLDILLKKNN